jgi:hypothetical protein
VRPPFSGQPGIPGTGAQSGPRSAPPVLGGQAGTAKANGLKGPGSPGVGEPRNRMSTPVLGGGGKAARKHKPAVPEEQITRGRSSTPVLGGASGKPAKRGGPTEATSIGSRDPRGASRPRSDAGGKVLGGRGPVGQQNGPAAASPARALSEREAAPRTGGPAAGRPGVVGSTRSSAEPRGRGAAGPEASKGLTASQASGGVTSARKDRKAKSRGLDASPIRQDGEDLWAVEKAGPGVLGTRPEQPPADAGPAIGR